MIDPSYIRNIRDGLKDNLIEANNLEALPDGLVGIYDKELFSPTLNWKQRKETLHFFLVFALAQKEISADFASTILVEEWCKVLANENETTEEKRLKKVNKFIQLHSKRFSAAGEGKFRLYHERFRLYILQKVSEGDVAQFNQKFISLCESELKNNTEKHISEKERYALEFLSTHYYISAMQGEKVCLNKEHAISLKKIAYDQAYWERQVKASKGFEWSKKILNEMMQWASKFDEEEVIECALNKVDLYHQEQNDSPRIVQLVADGDIETALQRIEAFGGNDLKQKEREFRLIISSIIEVIFLRNNDESLIKKRILPLSKKLSEFPADFYWPNSLDSYTLFKVCFELHQLGIECNLFLINDFKINFEWINESVKFSTDEINYLIFIAKNTTFEINSIQIISLLSTSLFKNNRLEESDNQIKNALTLADSLQSNYDKEDAYFIIYKQIIYQEKNDVLIRFLKEIKIDSTKKQELIKLKIVHSSIFDNNINLDFFINQINEDSYKRKLSRFITTQKMENNLLKRITNSEMLESSLYEKVKTSCTFLSITQKKLTDDEFDFTLNNKIIQINDSIKDPVTKSKAVLLCVRALSGKFQNKVNIDFLNIISNEWRSLKYSDWMNDVFKIIVAEFLKQKKYEEAKEVMIKSLRKNLNQFDDFSCQREGFLLSEYSVLKDVADIFIKKSNYNAAFILFNKHIKSSCHSSLVFYGIVDGLLSNNQIKAVNGFLQQTKREEYKKYISSRLIIYFVKNNDIMNAICIYEDHLRNFINLDFNENKLFLIEDQLIKLTKEMIKEQENLILQDELYISERFKRENSIIYSIKDIYTLDNSEIIKKIYKVRNDYLLSEHLVKMVCLNHLFFSDISPEKLDRYNRTLNLQWAIDIKNELPN
jgi:hypothetical protein